MTAAGGHVLSGTGPTAARGLSTWPDILTALIGRHDLDAATTGWVMGEILTGRASAAQTAGFAVALRAKGETAVEIAGLVDAMLAHGVELPVPPETSAAAIDTCGTGGDRLNTVNISTMAALVVAGAGELVIKHGNRAASSATGTADVLEVLGVPVVDGTAEFVARCAREAGIAFCFAPTFHPAMRHAGPVRRELGVATFFNVLGPLANPARPGAQVVGVADPRMAPVVAHVLAARGVSALVVRGQDGLDELSLASRSSVWSVVGGHVEVTEVDAADVGVAPAPVSDLVGGDAAHNARVVRALLDGAQGPITEAVVLNAAAAFAARAAALDPHQGSRPLTDRLADGVQRARDSLAGGHAAAALDRWLAVGLS